MCPSVLAATSAHPLPSPGRASKGLSRPRATASTAPSSRLGRRSRQPAKRRAPPRGPAQLVHQLSPEAPASLGVRILASGGLSPSAPAVPCPSGGSSRCKACGRGARRARKWARAAAQRLSGPRTPSTRRAPSLPPRRQEKFFPPVCPSPTPACAPWVGLGSLVKKVTRSHQLLLPLGTGWGWREAGAAADPGRPPAPPPPAELLSRGSAQRGAHEGGPPERVCARAAAVSNLLFPPACSATASQSGGKRESVCKVLLPGAQRRLLQLQLSFISPVNMRDHGRLRASQL